MEQDFYYYVLNKNNDKYYYSYITGKRLSKHEIPQKIIDLVQERNPKIIKYEKIAEIIDKRNKLQIKIDEMNLKILIYNNELSNLGISDSNDELVVRKLLKEYYDMLNLKIITKDINDPDLYFLCKL